MFRILHTNTVHNTAALADEGYCQSSGAHNIKHINLWKLALRGNLYTDGQSLYGEGGGVLFGIVLFSKEWLSLFMACY